LFFGRIEVEKKGMCEILLRKNFAQSEKRQQALGIRTVLNPEPRLVESFGKRGKMQVQKRKTKIG
jgi:hypothetical protein